MKTVPFHVTGCTLEATGSRGLYWPEERLIVVSDLHLGKSERIARRSGQMLPPYETQDTLARLDDLIAHFNPKRLICLGDSFDDLDASRNLNPDAALQINTLMAGREWVWIEGNHDPGPVELGGQHLASLTIGPLTFQHIAGKSPEIVEVSGHYHPKARMETRGRSVVRPCFLYDDTRVILPSFGTYTGGLFCTDPVLSGLMATEARAILTGAAPHIIPMPR